MGTSVKYLPLTESQQQSLQSWLDQGWTAVRIIDKGVEKLRVTKPRRGTRSQQIPTSGK